MGPVYGFVITTAMVLDAKDVVTERTDDASRSTPTKTEFFSFEEICAANQHLVNLKNVCQLSLGP